MKKELKSKTWVVGDLHGHFDQWVRLYKKLLEAGLDEEKDTLVFVGDYVDGGPQTKDVIDWLINYKKFYPQTQILLGNHEHMMLDALLHNSKVYGSYYQWFHQGGDATFESYLPKEEVLTDYEQAIINPIDVIPKEHLDFMESLPVYFENEHCFCVHGGVLPGVTLEDHKKILEKGGKEAEDLEYEMMWIRDEFINYPGMWEKPIVFGHTAMDEPLIEDNKIGIDGMFHNVGQLVAVEFPSRVVYIEKS